MAFFRKNNGIVFFFTIILCACSDSGDKHREQTTLIVVCRDIDNPEGRSLNEWSGPCEKGKIFNLNYLMKLDAGVDGNILSVGGDNRLISIHPDNTIIEGPLSATAWFRSGDNTEKRFSLTVNYKNIIFREAIHQARTLNDIPSGQIITRDYLDSNGMLPEILKYQYSHMSMEDMEISESAEITIWYIPFITVPVHYSSNYGDIAPEGAFDVLFGTWLTEEIIFESGVVLEIGGYTYESMYFTDYEPVTYNNRNAIVRLDYESL